MRRLFAIAIALVVLSACGGGASEVVTQTDVKTFIPWKEDGSGTLIPVIKETSGSCFGASSKVDAAYRCFVGTEIQDPCFIPPKVPNSNRVACAADPWSDITLVQLTGPLPPTSAATSLNPHWAVELENGDTCVSLGAAVGSTSNGVAMPYVCKSKSTASSLVMGSQPWIVQYNKNNISFDLTPVKVATAW
jgi:hypothetical protein